MLLSVSLITSVWYIVGHKPAAAAQTFEVPKQDRNTTTYTSSPGIAISSYESSKVWNTPKFYYKGNDGNGKSCEGEIYEVITDDGAIEYFCFHCKKEWIDANAVKEVPYKPIKWKN